MLTSPICCYLYPGGSSPPPTPHPLSFHPPPLLLLPGNLGLQLPFRAAKAALYPHRSWSERCHCRAAWPGEGEALLLDEAKQPCPALPEEKHPSCQGALLSSYLLPAPGPSTSHERPCCRSWRSQPVLHCACWRASHGKLCTGKGRPRSPGLHSTSTALSDILGRAVSTQGNLALLGKLWLHPALEFDLWVLVL